jgi:hypothetical protein
VSSFTGLHPGARNSPRIPIVSRRMLAHVPRRNRRWMTLDHDHGSARCGTSYLSPSSNSDWRGALELEGRDDQDRPVPVHTLYIHCSRNVSGAATARAASRCVAFQRSRRLDCEPAAMSRELTRKSLIRTHHAHRLAQALPVLRRDGSEPRPFRGAKGVGTAQRRRGLRRADFLSTCSSMRLRSWSRIERPRSATRWRPTP